MSYAVARSVQPQPGDELRSEYGWGDVQSGLAKILQGYAVLLGGLSLCTFLIVAAAVQLAKAGTGKVPLTPLWFFYLGLGLTALIGPIGYGMIALGKWRCLMNAPERHHCRWLMFACMACLLMGPALNITANVTGLQKAPELKRGPQAFRDLEFTKLGGALQAVSGILSAGSLVLFVLFLRGVATCFGDEARVRLTSIYLALLAFVFGISLYLLFADFRSLAKPPVLITLGGVWLVVFVGYLFLIGTTRACIANGIARLRSPLQAPPPEANANTAAPARAWPVI